MSASDVGDPTVPGCENQPLRPWPPSARHHHGFMRSGIMWVGDDDYKVPVLYADDRVGDQGNGRAVSDLERQRKDEWMEFYTAREDDLKGHPCLPPFRCLWTFMGEVLALAEQEGVDTSIVTGSADDSGRSTDGA